MTEMRKVDLVARALLSGESYLNQRTRVCGLTKGKRHHCQDPTTRPHQLWISRELR